MTFPKIILLAVVLAVIAIEPSLAADGDGAEGWEQPAVGLIGTLESGLVKIGAVVVGIGAIALGIWAAISGRLQWDRVGYVVIGGILVMAGPTMLRALLAAAS